MAKIECGGGDFSRICPQQAFCLPAELTLQLIEPRDGYQLVWAGALSPAWGFLLASLLARCISNLSQLAGQKLFAAHNLVLKRRTGAEQTAPKFERQAFYSLAGLALQPIPRLPRLLLYLGQ